MIVSTNMGNMTSNNLAILIVFIKQLAFFVVGYVMMLGAGPPDGLSI